MTAEERLEKIARGLGDRAAQKLDVAAVANGVIARLRRDEPTVSVRWRRVALQMAAVVLISVAVGLYANSQRTVDFDFTAPVELTELSEDELDQVMDSLLVDQPMFEVAAVGLYDLDEQELEDLLELMEG